MNSGNESNLTNTPILVKIVGPCSTLLSTNSPIPSCKRFVQQLLSKGQLSEDFWLPSEIPGRIIQAIALHWSSDDASLTFHHKQCSLLQIFGCQQQLLEIPRRITWSSKASLTFYHTGKAVQCLQIFGFHQHPLPPPQPSLAKDWQTGFWLNHIASSHTHIHRCRHRNTHVSCTFIVFSRLVCFLLKTILLSRQHASTHMDIRLCSLGTNAERESQQGGRGVIHLAMQWKDHCLILIRSTREVGWG